MLKLVIFAIVLGSIQAQKCPSSPVDLGFDPNRYLGRWYEIQVFPNIFQPDLSCVTANYGYGGVNNVTVFNYGVDANNQPTTISGWATITNPNTPNYLTVFLRVPITPNLFITNSGKYDVWETDYNTYSLVYSCSINQTSEIAWVLSRTPTLSQTIVDRLEALLRSRGVDSTKFKKTNQLNCPPNAK